MAIETYEKQELESFKTVQKIAYESVIEVRKELKVGITEKETASLINKYLKQKGVDGFFHYGFAWFGDRTSFTGFKRPSLLPAEWIENLTPPHLGIEFMPTNRKLENGMPVILDVAPVLGGFSADIGYSFAFGENSEVDKSILDLEIFRTAILKLVLEEKTMSFIYTYVNNLISDLGYTNCHSIYPMGVLAHKLGKIPFKWLPSTNIMGFQLQTFLYILGQMAEKTLNGMLQNSPLWGEKAIEEKPEIGLWAVEPHIGKKGIGVKWEEILVVTDSTAYWLDDDLPHVNFWKESKLQ